MCFFFIHKYCSFHKLTLSKAMAALFAPKPTAILIILSIYSLSMTSWSPANINSSSTAFYRLAIPGIFFSYMAFRMKAASVAPEAKFKCPICPLYAVITVFFKFDLSYELTSSNFSSLNISR